MKEVTPLQICMVLLTAAHSGDFVLVADVLNSLPDEDTTEVCLCFLGLFEGMGRRFVENYEDFLPQLALVAANLEDNPR